MRMIKVTLGCILIASSLHAQPAESPRQQARKGPAEFEALDLALRARVEESGALFYRLTEAQSATAKELELRIALDGRPLLTEKMTLRRSAAKQPAFELLAKEPETLRRLRALQDSRPNRVTISVALDGRIVYASSFAEFVEYNRMLRMGSFEPQVTDSKVRSFAPALAGPAVPLQKALSCEGQCAANYQWCLENVCQPQGMFFCEECEVEYSDCINSCPPPPPPPCTDPKSVREYTTTQLVGYGWTGYSQCLESVFDNDFYEGEWYDEYQYRYKDTRIRRTEYCNGSVTEEVLWVSYWGFYCNRPTFWTCYYPWTWEYNVCF